MPPDALKTHRHLTPPRTQFTCFTGTKVQILTQLWGEPDVDALKLTATLRLLGGDKSEKASVEGVKSEKASVEGVTSPPQTHKKEEESKKEHGAIEIRIERPAGISSSVAALLQLQLCCSSVAYLKGAAERPAGISSSLFKGLAAASLRY